MNGPRMVCGASLLLASALLAGCNESVTGPAGPATATLTLTSPVTDGAILLRVTGPRFESAPAPAKAGLLVYSRQVSDSELSVAVFGPIANGVLFQVDIPDGRQVGSYTASIVQVADGENDLRGDVSGYSATMTAARRN
jgi:hypothetical protein